MHRIPISLGDTSFADMNHLQPYNPLYSRLFDDLTPDNYNGFALEHPYRIHSANEVIHQYTQEIVPRDIFIKYAPLLDPIKYMTGKYDVHDPKLRTLPQWTSTETDCLPKMLHPQNASYTDAFFYYWSSYLKHHHGFHHGIDFYGSYLGIQDVFRINVENDLDYLTDSPVFLANVGKLYAMEHFHYQDSAGSRGYRPPLIIDHDGDVDIEIEDVNDMVPMDVDTPLPHTPDVVYQAPVDDSESSSDSESEPETDSESDDSNNNESDWETETESTQEDKPEDEEAVACIYQFPVQMICLERCSGTLDSLFTQKLVDDALGASILFQIIMILLVYQRAFKFTHNDLHTNNIMYVPTDQEFLYYTFEGTTYRVPTYGRIYKIIDYGRAIYKYRGMVFCSDSFDKGGDASTQYNCEPFMNPSKPRLEPNPSFDLCRLGSSIYDFLVEDEHEALNPPKSELERTIRRWCTDDQRRNVLYKKNGSERYPGFSLYKTIARTVHEHTPQNQLKDAWFQQFAVKTGVVGDGRNWMNVDQIPCFA